MRKLVLLAPALALFSATGYSQVKIGSNPSSINASSALEIESSDKGILIPRVALTATNSAAFMAATPVEGTLVYNAAGALQHGFYYWDGAQWELMAKSSSLTGTGGVFSLYNGGTGAVMNAPLAANTAAGNHALAAGSANTASAQFSTALGQSNTASGSGAFAAGYSNAVSSQFGGAVGQSNLVSGNTAFTAGYSNQATQQYSIALGQANQSTGNTAFTAGYSNISSAQYSAALGQSNQATGAASIAAGYYNTAGPGSYAVALGASNVASGNNGSAIGYNNTASGMYALALGTSSTAGGVSAIALGSASTATGLGAMAMGTYANTNNQQYSIVMADGTPTTASMPQQFTAHFSNGYRLQLGLGKGLELEGGGTLRPTVDGGQDLGSSTMRWNTIYAQNGTVQTSDLRFKEHIRPLGYGLATVMQLHPIAYDWKGGGGHKIGFSAQEVQGIIPEVVHTGNDARQTLGINYAEMVSVLVKAVQEQQVQIEELKAENIRIREALKGR